MNEDWREDLLRIPAKGLLPLPGCNPRRRFDQKKHEELVASIRAKGIREPLLVHDNWGGESIPELPQDHRFWIVAGERRWRAASEVGPDAEVPCLVGIYTMAEALQIALIENLERDDLTTIEEARGYQRLLESGMTQRELAEKIGRAQPTIANALRLLQLPDPVLELVESGVVAASHARDILLPFAKIPEAKRAKLYAAVEKQLAKAVKDLEDVPLQPHIVRHAVIQEALKLSRPIAPEFAAWNDQKRPEFPEAAHKACTCGGPEFEYQYGKHVRCFDEAWWDAAQADAQKKQEQERAAREEKVKGGASAGPAPEMPYQKFVKTFGYQDHVELRADKYGPLLDPAELAGAPIVIVLEGTKHDIREPHVVDGKAIKKAKASATRELNKRLKAAKAERAQKYLARAAKADLEPWMLAQILDARPQNDALLEVSREIGIDIGKHGQVGEGLQKLSAEQVTTLFKVLALRAKAGDLNAWNDPLERKIKERLQEEYSPGIHALKKAALRPPAPEPAAAATDVGSKAQPLELPGGGWGFRAGGKWSTAKERTGPFAAVKRAKRITELDAWAAERAAAVDVHTVGQDLDAGEELATAFRELTDAYEAAEFNGEDAPTPDQLKTLREKVDAVRQAMERNQVEMGTPDEEELLADAEVLLEQEGDSRCVICGCTDSHACDGGCGWTLSYAEEGIGVCDACEPDSLAAHHVIEAFRRGEDVSRKEPAA